MGTEELEELFVELLLEMRDELLELAELLTLELELLNDDRVELLIELLEENLLDELLETLLALEKLLILEMLLELNILLELEEIFS